ncbi:MAG TPA: putative glycoside hydrolase [Candidatus Humimicrobiaceae bacterium]|nr:putative glycoside hydrolase [Candidatus Humimicrobiaceae bacterium]
MRIFFKICIAVLLVLIFSTLAIVFFNLLNSSNKIIVDKEIIINGDLGNNLSNTDIGYPATTVKESEEESNFIPPEIVKAIYLTSWSASKKSSIDYLIDIASTTEINSVVIDIKDFSGYLSYDSSLDKAKEYKSEQIRIKDIRALIKSLQKENIYTIARIVVFQDPVLAKARPDLAIQSKTKLVSSAFKNFTAQTLWLDKSGLAWIDPLSKEAWDYNISVAKEAIELGFNEVNFDYIRFPTDGNLTDMVYPIWDGETTKPLIIKEFLGYIREKLPEASLSIDLFGLATIKEEDFGVGQIIEDAFQYFDYICPMLYPSHYADGFNGYQNPAEHPYEVVRYCTEQALLRLEEFKKKEEGLNPQLRPWLQDFDLGADYDAEMVKAEIRAVQDATGDSFKGYILWNPTNFYTKDALNSSYLE